MKISKYCKSLKDAEKFQNKLYNSYNNVKLIDFPKFSEGGIYEWNVN